MSCTVDEQKQWIVAEAFHAAFQVTFVFFCLNKVLLQV